MPYLSEDRIASVVERVVSRLQDGATPASLGFQPEPPKRPASPPVASRPESRTSAPRTYGTAGRQVGGMGKGVFATLDEAANAAREAFNKFRMVGLQARHKIIDEMRRESRLHVEAMSQMALDETGLGRYEHKLLKNQIVIDKTPGPEILETWAQSGDDGLTLEEYAPYGVIG
ncbi:hypothetical protein KAI87_11065, partial [Myxococcota bacterium]|nr:hypothetical protein [Myxococcota bacterium]